MAVQTIKGAEVRYFLIVLDENGKERREADGSLLSETISKRLKKSSPSDVFVMSHGWMADVPGAIAQYDAWVPMLASANPDPRRTPLYVGLHWPSLPWGDETMPSGAGVLGASGATINSLVDAYASRIADTKEARDAIRDILADALAHPGAADRSPAVLKAYGRLFKELGLALKDVSGPPGTDQKAFDPDVILKDAREHGLTDPPAMAPGVLGGGGSPIGAALWPLRTLSFWKMKDRARQIGEVAGHDLLRSWMTDAPSARFHLMGHSFGCIVVSASVAGAQTDKALPRQVDTLFLVQGALSLWSFADVIPYVEGGGISAAFSTGSSSGARS